MKVALLGKSGMLGSAFLNVFLGENFQVFAFNSQELDVTDYVKVAEVLGQVVPDVVINCTGYTKVDLAETEREEAFALNGAAVCNLAKLSKLIGFKLIHFSTDYVFSGEKSEGYFEEDVTGPINVYGESKLAGERAVLEETDRGCVIRTSWLFGPEGANFVKTMVQIGREKGEVSVVNDQFGEPTYTLDLARAVVADFLLKEAAAGIYHLTNQGRVSWYEFAGKVFELADLKVKLSPISSEEFRRPASRPKCSVLLNGKLPLLRPYTEALKAYIDLHFR